jgi:filamentous hemagglutinin family protein
MTNSIQTWGLLTRKTFSVIALLVIGLTAFTTCDAQSIVGKWKGVSVTNYYSDDYAKQMGKSMEEKLAKETGNSEIDYNADHSFKMIFYETNSSEATIMKGTWSVAGDQLKLTLESQFNPKGTSTNAHFTINGNTMVTTAVIAPPARIIKTVSTSTRL